MRAALTGSALADNCGTNMQDLTALSSTGVASSASRHLSPRRNLISQNDECGGAKVWSYDFGNQIRKGIDCDLSMALLGEYQALYLNGSCNGVGKKWMPQMDAMCLAPLPGRRLTPVAFRVLHANAPCTWSCS